MRAKPWIWLAAFIQCAASGADAADAPYLFDLLQHRPIYRKTWDALLARGKPIPAWIMRFSKTYDGVTAPADMVTVDGVAYQAFNVCRPHACDTNSLEVYFTIDGATAYGAILDPASRDLRFLGAPPAAVAAALAGALKP